MFVRSDGGSGRSSGAMTIGLLVLIFSLSGYGCARQNSKAMPAKASVTASPIPPEGIPDEEGHPGEGPMAEIAQYKERLKKDPRDLEALIFLGNSNFDIKRYEKAKELYIQALLIDPKNPSVRTDLASCFRYLGEPDQALVELKTVLAIHPDHIPALYNLGVILLDDKNDRAGAISAWEELVKKHPESPYSHGLAEKIALLQKKGGEASR